MHIAGAISDCRIPAGKASKFVKLLQKDEKCYFIIQGTAQRKGEGGWVYIQSNSYVADSPATGGTSQNYSAHARPTGSGALDGREGGMG